MRIVTSQMCPLKQLCAPNHGCRGWKIRGPGPLQMFSILVSWLFHTTSLKDKLALVSLRVYFLSEIGQFIPVGIQVWKLCLGILPRYTSSTEYVWQQREEQYNESER